MNTPKKKLDSTLDALYFEVEDLEKLIKALINRGYEVYGPAIEEEIIAYRKITSIKQLPAGWTEVQEKATYTLKKRDDNLLFGYNLSSDLWKRILFPPFQRLFTVNKDKWTIEQPQNNSAKLLAFFGVRPCELNAIKIQDKIFLEGKYQSADYCKRRENLFIIAVNCTRCAPTCFCVSMNSGPKATAGFDLALTEVLSSGKQFYILNVGSERGLKLCQSLSVRVANPAEKAEAVSAVERTVNAMTRTLDAAAVKKALYSKFEDPYWDKIATRCMTCGNCTMVCPTCFCNQVEDGSSLNGTVAWRNRKWDSCYTVEFSYIHGGSIRASPKSRFRQWMTHKLATWYDQFGTSGCVGCGRCITWCPAGIDITEEALVFLGQETDKQETTK